VVGLIAVAALVVGIIDLTRPSSSGAGKASTPASPSPTFTPDQVASANPALNANDRDAARALASSYWITNAVSSVTDAASPLYQTTLDDAKRAADAMAAVCR